VPKTAENWSGKEDLNLRPLPPEGSVLAVLALGELGIKTIWAKASNARHGLILEKLGVSKVVYPETEMGRALADQICPASLP
jgi:Trk K+ transport system NAD-binding subunit